MNENFSFQMSSFLTTGCGSFKEIGNRASRYGRKILIISDTVMEKIGLVEKLINILQESNLEAETYCGIDSEPTDINVNEALAICNSFKPDLLVAIGGGSSLDTGKAVAVMYSNPGDISDYMGYNKLKEDGLPIIAIPTTAGTGSEASKVTVITNTKNDVKMMLSDPHLLPTEAIVDPELTRTMPNIITASTGIDALTHAIEAFVSKRAQPFTNSLALSAIEDISKYLRRSYNDNNDMEARSTVMYGALKAGMAFSNASVCLVHGMSRPIGALFHVPHGVSNAMLLPVVMQYSLKGNEKLYSKIGERMGLDIRGLSYEEAANYTVNEVRQLCADLDIPNLKKWGIDKEHLEQSSLKMAGDALDSGSPQNNPKVPSVEEIIELYDQAYDYDFSTSLLKTN